MGIYIIVTTVVTMTDANEKHIREVVSFLNKNNRHIPEHELVMALDVPDDVLDLILNASLEKLAHINRIKDLKCPNCKNETVWGTVLIRNGVEIPQSRIQRDGKTQTAIMIFKCNACEFEWG